MKLEPQRITSATTKVRRLGYFALFSKILRENPLPRLSLQQRILNKEEDNRELLEEACKRLPVTRTKPEYVTGEIRSKDAFKRYLNTAKELGLVHELSGRLYNTKRGDILSTISENDNPFKLSLAQNYILLKTLLEKDYDYLRTATICSIKKGPNEHNNFFFEVNKIWKQKILNVRTKNIEVYDKLQKAMNKKYRNPKRYYRDDIKGPRLEWFLDLNIIEFWNIKKNRVKFRDNIINLLDSYNENFSNSFVFYMKPMIKGSITYWQEVSWTNKNEYIEELLEKSFNLFQPSHALRKISANQFLEYGVSNLIESGIICEIDNLDNALAHYVRSKFNKYRYVTIVSDVDKGYISKL